QGLRQWPKLCWLVYGNHTARIHPNAEPNYSRCRQFCARYSGWVTPCIVSLRNSRGFPVLAPMPPHVLVEVLFRTQPLQAAWPSGPQGRLIPPGAEESENGGPHLGC